MKLYFYIYIFFQFVVPPATDEKCVTEQECYQCWILCEDLITDHPAYAPICDNIAACVRTIVGFESNNYHQKLLFLILIEISNMV